MRKEFSAGLIVYRETAQGPRFLLLYHGGRYWSFPKGHIEYKKAESPVVTTTFENDETQPQGEEWSVRETSKEAAIRETFEETGLIANELDVKKGFRAVERFNFFRNREHILKTVIFYVAETTESKIKMPVESENSEPFYGFGWFLYKDARYILASYKGSQKLLRSAYEFIRSKSGPVAPVSERRGTDGYHKRAGSRGRDRHLIGHRDKRREGEKREGAYYLRRKGESYDIV